MENNLLMEKAKNELVNLIQSENYSPELKLQRLDELVVAYKFQLKKEEN